MNGPGFQRKLVLEAQSHMADGAGGFTVTWAPLGTLWAQIVPRTGREAVVSGQQSQRQQWVISVRGAPVGSVRRPRPDQRFRKGTRVFNILSVAETDPLGRYLRVDAVEEAAP